jgi:outer membrane protein insertion porin family
MRRGLLVLGVLLAAAPPLSSAEPPVVAVRVEADGGDAQRLQRYADEVDVGAPLDPEVVRHLVELIHATGEYEDVVVETRPADGGVAVVLRPRPAPRLREVRVEGDRVLSQGDVRDLTRLRPGEPLWRGRLERAARDVALGLVEKGYLEARVEPVLPTSGGPADAVFQVRAGPRARVGKVETPGLPASLASTAGRKARPRPGEVFERARVKKSAEEMRSALADHGYWQATVEAAEVYDPRSARVDLSFRAAPGPLVDVVFRGREVSRSLRGDVQDAVKEGQARSDALEDAGERIAEALRKDGYRDANVRYVREAAGARLHLVYEVSAGPPAHVASVTVTGDAAAPVVPLRTRVQAPLRDADVEADAQALQQALEDAGHASARVLAEVPEGGGPQPVLFRLRAGARVRVTRVRVESPDPLPADSPPQELRTREGGPYRLRDLARDRQTVATAYRNAGFLQAEVAPEAVFGEAGDEVQVTFRVVPGPPTRLEHVVIAGLTHTREDVVRRELLLEEGQPLGLQRILETQRRLSALGLFQRVSVTEVDPESPLRRSVVVQAEEAPLISLVGGLGYAERDGVRGSVEIARRNLFGLDRRISLFGRASFRTLRLVTSYREPYLLGRRQELFVTAFREEEDRDAFDFVRQGITVQTSRALTPRLSLIVRETFQETRTFDLDEDCLRVDRAFCPGRVSGPSASLVHDTRDDPLDPRRGHLLLTDAQLSLGALGGDDLIKAYVQAATYILLNTRTLVSVSGRLGLARTFQTDEPDLPPPDRFFAGGDYSLRGFGVDDVRPDGGNALLLGGLELRLKAAGDVWAAAFTDVGNVYRLASDLTLSDLRYTAGLGLRYRSAVGPLRVDWGYKLNRRGDEKPYHIHITVGHAF